MRRLWPRRPVADAGTIEIDLEAVLAGDSDATPDPVSVRAALAVLADARRETEATRKALRKAIDNRPKDSMWGNSFDPVMSGREEQFTRLEAREAAIARAIARLRSARGDGI